MSLIERQNGTNGFEDMGGNGNPGSYSDREDNREGVTDRQRDRAIGRQKYSQSHRYDS